MLKRLIASAFALLLTTTSLSATDLYIGAGLGGSSEAGSFRHNLEDVSDSGGDPWKLFAGWSLGRHLAVEVARHEMGDQNCCRGFADFGFSSKVDGFSASALGRWPVERFTPFVRAGVLAWEEDGEMISFSGPAPRSDDGTDLLLGAGLDYDLFTRLTIRAEWEKYEFSDASSDSLWASLLFRF
jgi:opacity protein-like surface antigen